jgi:deoxyribodipyrimidine photo-lyase
LIDWKQGEAYFAKMLTDYDPASNNGNWQWIAGTGADSQPYFRVFNPWEQSKHFDSEAIYIKKWIPELKDVPSKDIHDWFKFHIKHDNIKYPEPIVDYNKQKILAMEMYKKIFH